MNALDTNVVVRFLTRDDPAQAARAKVLIATESLYLPKSVVLKTAWLLRSRYRYERTAIVEAMTRLLGLPGMMVEDQPTVARALAWYAQGLDFADALHLASSTRAASFATFDQALRRRARRISGTLPVVAP